MFSRVPMRNFEADIYRRIVSSKPDAKAKTLRDSKDVDRRKKIKRNVVQ